jgi:hydroxyethylthiazole kinase
MRHEPKPGPGGLTADEVAELLARVRGASPRIHAITNAAAQVFTANLLLAAGAVPSLTIAPAEVGAFTARAAGLLVNLGTLDDDRLAAIPLAIARARQDGKPWVLDPVFVEASPVRRARAMDLIGETPAVLRCNAREFVALAGEPADDDKVARFARERGIVVALTGAEDLVTDGSRAIRIRNGHPMMARITAMGCAGTALLTAFLTVESDALRAAAAALAVLGVAGEMAGTAAKGPGTFQPAFLDCLYSLTRDDLTARARLA